MAPPSVKLPIIIYPPVPGGGGVFGLRKSPVPEKYHVLFWLDIVSIENQCTHIIQYTQYLLTFRPGLSLMIISFASSPDYKIR